MHPSAPEASQRARTEAAGTVVVGVDGSDTALAATRWAASLARSTGRPLTVACGVAEPGPLRLEAPLVHGFDYAGALREAGRHVLDEARAAARALAPDLEVREVLEVGDPRTLLIGLSGTAATVVVGTSGRGPLRRVLLGSVAVAVLRRARCPVVVIPSHPHERDDPRVVVGVDGGEGTTPLLVYAVDEAARRGLRLVVVLCRVDAARWTGRPAVDDRGDEAARADLEELLAPLRAARPDLDIAGTVLGDWPQGGLVAASEGADLLVVGHAEAGPSRRFLLGSVAVSVAESATCPVAVVPLGGA